VTSINLLLANEIQDGCGLEWGFLQLACTSEKTCYKFRRTLLKERKLLNAEKHLSCSCISLAGWPNIEIVKTLRFAFPRTQDCDCYYSAMRGFAVLMKNVLSESTQDPISYSLRSGNTGNIFLQLVSQDCCTAS